MTQWLKQSTAAILKLGPFVDDTDGKTAETGLTIAQADIQLSKNGGAFAQTSDAAPTTTHDADGWYPTPLTTTDTGTLGRLEVQVAMAGALPVFASFMVVPANVYDSLVLGSASDYLDVNVVAIANDAITAATIATGAIDADAIADNAIDAGAIASDAITAAKIADNAISDQPVASVSGAVGSVTGAVGSVTGAVGSVTGNVGGNVTGSVGSLATQAKADVNAEVVDALATDIIADSVPADGTRPTIAQAAYMLVQFMLERAVSGTTVTVKKADGSTTLFALTLDSATAPTTITRSS